MLSRGVVGVVFLLAGCLGRSVRVPEGMSYVRHLDEETGWVLHELRANEGSEEELAVRICPAAGGNAYSLSVGGTELLHEPPVLTELPGSAHGVSILYPTPGRVRGGELEFEGQTFPLPSDTGREHLHGIVADRPWAVGDVEVQEQERIITLPLVLDIQRRHPLYEIFPFDHRIELRYSLGADGLLISFTLKNRDTRRIPVAFGVRAAFRVPGERSQVYVQVPARRLMRLGRFDRVPTGKLRELDGLEQDLRSLVPLGQRKLDDVYWGMAPGRPIVWEPRAAGVRVVLEASEIFTHATVEAAAPDDGVAIGYLTSAPNAHDLYANGAAEAAHLIILEPVGSPGSTAEGGVFLRVEPASAPAAPLAEVAER